MGSTNSATGKYLGENSELGETAIGFLFVLKVPGCQFKERTEG